MEFWWNFRFQIPQTFLKGKHSFTEFFDKISNPYNKRTQKILEFFDNYR